MDTLELQSALRRFYDPKSHAIIFEVANSTGFAANRWCDALVMSLWPSRGVTLTGIECKISRGDWLAELKNPAKAESIYRFCDYWMLVVGSPDIIKEGELPKTWGLIVPNGKGGLRVKVPAKDLTPIPITREFLASIFRKVSQGSVDEKAIKKAEADGYKQGYKEGTEHGERISKYAQERLVQLAKRVSEFQAASGLNVEYGWHHGKDLGQAVRAVLSGGLLKNDGLITARNLAKAFVNDVDALMQSTKLKRKRFKTNGTNDT